MGYYMVYWGAGVHQWQVTLDQLFHQLYVSTLHSQLRRHWLTVAVGKYCAGHILSAQLLGQDGDSPAIPQALRAKP